MTWVKIDDGAPEHPKLVDLSDAGLALWLRALCYCARRRTDGLVTNGALRILSRAKTPTKVAAELVTAKLWDVCEDGYRVHDYHHYQPSKAQIEAASEAASEAKRAAGKLGGKRSAEVRWGVGGREADGKQTVSRTEAGAQQTVTPDPDPDPLPEYSHSAGARADDTAETALAVALPASSSPGPPERMIELDQPGSPPQDDLIRYLGDLATVGHPWARKVHGGLLEQGGRLFEGQRETLIRIRGERDAEAAARAVAPAPEPRGRARPRDHQVQGGPSFIEAARAEAAKPLPQPTGDDTW
jgi:hypothetical protein